MRKKKLETVLTIALAMAVSVSTSIFSLKTETYALETSYSYSFENVEVPYSGTWVSFDGGFQLYLPNGWTESTVLGGADGTGEFYTATATDGSGWYLTVSYDSAENMGGAFPLDSLWEFVSGATEYYSSAALITINGTDAILFDSATDPESGIFFSEANGGIFTVCCGLTDDAGFAATGTAMLMSLTVEGQESEESIVGVSYPVFAQEDTGYGYSIMRQTDGTGTYQQMLDSCIDDSSVFYQIPYFSDGSIQVYDSADWTGGLVGYSDFLDYISWLETMHEISPEDSDINLASFDLSKIGLYGSEWGTESTSILSISIYTGIELDGSRIMPMTEMGSCELMTTGEYGYVYWIGCATSEEGLYSDYIRCETDSGTVIDFRFCEDGTLRVCSDVPGVFLTEGMELECLYIYQS